MDPQQPVIQPVESIISPTSPQPPQSPKSSNSLTVISMALFILLSLGAVAFLYYQNQQLKTMLASYQTPVPVASPTPIATETPVESASPSATVNPVVTSPLANTKVSSPLTITGTVPDGWIFEGSFPIKLVDSTRNQIASGTAKETVPGSWQNGKPVKFSVTLPFSTMDSSGFLILSKDNPSGLPVNDKSFEVPVKF